MTRINVGIPPEDLHDKHLLAEHREIKRIPNIIASGRANIKDIPKEFTLGKGHVKFFYNKIFYLAVRYNQLHKECIKRGFNVTDYSSAFNGTWPSEGPPGTVHWKPSEEDIALIKERIAQRLLTMKT